MSTRKYNILVVSAISWDFLRRLCRNWEWPFVTRYFITRKTLNKHAIRFTVVKHQSVLSTALFKNNVIQAQPYDKKPQSEQCGKCGKNIANFWRWQWW